MATINLTETDFETTVLENDIVVVDFWADWCGPCKSFAPTFETSSEKHTDIVHAKVDTDSEGGIAQAFGIRSIPTIAIFREKELVYKQAGALPPAQLESVLAQAKALDMDEVRAKRAEAEATASS